jgi:subtilase family serine protease
MSRFGAPAHFDGQHSLAQRQPLHIRASEIKAPAHPNASSSPVGFQPEQIRSAYGINSIGADVLKADGSGQTIAIVDAYNDPAIVRDLNAFDKQFTLTSKRTTIFKQFGPAKSFLSVIDQNGQKINPAETSSPGPEPVPSVHSSVSWEGEESLDVEWAHAIAPGAKIDLIEVNNLNGLINGVNIAKKLPGVSVVSLSWGKPEFVNSPSYNVVFTTPPGHRNETFLAASGDSGSLGAWYPAYSPGVVAVGATTLSIGANNSYETETGWSGSGGGFTKLEPEPTFQEGVQQMGLRSIPDVSFIGNPAFGTAVYDSFDSPDDPWIVVGGTSLATPCWAGLIAIADQLRAANGGRPLNGATQTLPALYSLPSSDFHDITGGSNGLYTAAAGYDEVTGLGSPVANRLVPALATYGLTHGRSG